MLRQAWETNLGDFKHKAGIRYSPDVAFLTKDFITRAAKLFDEAETLARSDQIRQRVDIARLPILYVKLSAGRGGWTMITWCWWIDSRRSPGGTTCGI